MKEQEMRCQNKSLDMQAGFEGDWELNQLAFASVFLHRLLSAVGQFQKNFETRLPTIASKIAIELAAPKA